MKMWLRIQVFSISASDAMIDNTLIETKLCEHIVRILIVQVAYLIFIRKKKKKKHNQKRTSIVHLKIVCCAEHLAVCVLLLPAQSRAHTFCCAVLRIRKCTFDAYLTTWLILKTICIVVVRVWCVIRVV